VKRWLGLLRSLVIYWRPFRQRELRELYRPFVSPGDLVFDVGAHLGDRTAAFAALGARVVALEPEPMTARWLRRLVGGKEGVTILEEAVGPEAGTARLAVSRATPTLSTLADGWRERVPEENPGFADVRWEERVEVPVTTLDRLVERFGEPAFVKVDVEGFEADVLAGLGHPPPALSFEFVGGALDVAVACVDRLEALADGAVQARTGGGEEAPAPSRHRYDFNAIRGEERDFVFPAWRTADEARAWLEAGAGGMASGDVYARLVKRPPSASPSGP